MKVYISCDIEGIAGITDWEEATKTHGTYPEFREEMTAEVLAACEGAIAAGATEILIWWTWVYLRYGHTWQHHGRRSLARIARAGWRAGRPLRSRNSGRWARGLCTVHRPDGR